jgi:hypothetical protein
MPSSNMTPRNWTTRCRHSKGQILDKFLSSRSLLQQHRKSYRPGYYGATWTGSITRYCLPFYITCQSSPQLVYLDWWMSLMMLARSKWWVLAMRTDSSVNYECITHYKTQADWIDIISRIYPFHIIIKLLFSSYVRVSAMKYWNELCRELHGYASTNKTFYHHLMLAKNGVLSCDALQMYCPARIRVRIDPPHPLMSRKRRLNGAVLRMRPEKPRSRVTAGVAQ